MSTKVRRSPVSVKPSERPLRADAQRNRDRLLAAADAVFTERGADGSMEEVARRAEVGIGTLYRHFPTREALLAATFDDRLLALADTTLAQAARKISPAASLQTFLEQLVFQTGIYSGLATSLGVVLQSGTPGCHATTEAGQELLARAQKQDEIRRDVQFEDVVCMATAISLAVQKDPLDLRRSQRLVTMFMDGLRATAVQKRQPRAAKKRS